MSKSNIGYVKLSVVVPCYNDSARISQMMPVLLQYLRTLRNCPWEVILVDDGSLDWEQTRALAEAHGASFIGLPENQGKGAAVRRGMLEARGEFRIFTDSDIPFQPEAIGQFLRYLDDKEFHLVIGDRTLPQSRYHELTPVSRSIGSFLFSMLVSHFVVGGWRDTQCGLKGFRADVAVDLFGRARICGFGFDVEILYLALKRNYDIKRLPVELRYQGESHVSIWRDGIGIFCDLLRLYGHRIRGRYALNAPPHALPAPAFDQKGKEA